MADGEEGKMKFNERLQVARGLLRFLNTENISVDGMLKSELNDLYENQFTLYWKQIHPESSKTMPDLKSLLSSAVGSKLIRVNKTSVFLPRYQEKKASNQQSNQEGQAEKAQSGRSSQSPNEPTPPPTATKTKQNNRRYRRGRVQHRIAVDQHITSLQKLVPLTKEAIDAEDVTKFRYIGQVGNRFICSLCPTTITSKLDVINHVNGKKHRLSYCVKMIKDNQKELLDGKHDVAIECMAEKDTKGTYMINSEEGRETSTIIKITNNGGATVELTHCEMMKQLRVYKLIDSHRVTDSTGGTAKIQPGQSYEIKVRLLARQVGSYHCPVMFQFAVSPPQGGASQPQGDGRQPQGATTFLMVRYLHARCRDPIVDELKPKTKYKKPPQLSKMAEESVEIEAGEKPVSLLEDQLERKIELKQYRVPQKIRKMINRGMNEEAASLTPQDKAEMTRLKNILESPVCVRDYQTRMEALLFFEEVQMEVDIRKYDMEDATMTVSHSNRRLLVLKVPGLAEKRPSVLVGDCLYVRLCEADGKLGKKEYQGYVHEVLQNQVSLGFSQNFRNSFMEKQKFRVRFMFNRLPTCLQHRACEMARELSLDKIIAPNNSLPENYTLPDLMFYNRDIQNNRQQKCAVQHIVAGTSRPAPYIVFGPPGTGKTVTIVEAIKQIWKLQPDSHILACTPSNSACDLITARLLQHVTKSSILRLNAKSRTWSAVPEAIKGVCNVKPHSGGLFFMPDKKKLSEYRIIVSTLVTAGRLVSANFPSGHFSHVIVDEAGHAMEPEALIPIAGIMEVSGSNPSTGGQIVLAGDPKQLGPVLRSPLAIKYGLSTSLLERYMDTCDLYIPGSTMRDQSGTSHRVYDVRVITKLLQNYRSHPAILKLPNAMFYDNELQACASEDRNKLCQWEELPKKGFPVIFDGVIGEDMREERSPSFFNPEEVSLVVKYVKKLMSCRKGGINLQEKDIGVIAPYSKQVQKIKQMLRKEKYDKISVGSVEEFQGAERTVIIVSTVRSKPEYMSLDMHFKLGFLRNPKRFNVTITRAKALLVVIGNPETLRHDPHWRSLIEYCEENGSCRGVAVGGDKMTEEDQLEDLCQRLESLDIIDGNLNMTELLHADPELAQQPWRSEI